tara:strand:- start:31 stop:531 length:501 start_codon:yes stop_codon:yes gene_type:complete
MARTAKITNANVGPRQNVGGNVGNTPVRAQDFNNLVDESVSQSDTSAQTIASALTVSGGLALGSETLTSAGAASILVPITILANTGAHAISLADGVVGQIKIFLSRSDYTVTLTPANTSGSYSTIATTNVGEVYMLAFDGTGWSVISRASGDTQADNAVDDIPVLA